MRDSLLIERTKFLWNTVCYERIEIRNYAGHSVRVAVDVLFGSDFHDLFEVRGLKRQHRGFSAERIVTPDAVELLYEGLDEVTRCCSVTFAPAPKRLLAHRATWLVDISTASQQTFFVRVACEENGSKSRGDFFSSYRDAHRARRASTADIARVTSSNMHFDEVAARAVSDVYTLATRTEHGLYPYAGIPWFSTVFGRDGIITALLMLWIDPKIARGVLFSLAEMQAVENDAASDSQPGKILHEVRHGEMANLREVPFRRYYGSVDSTPLFLMLADMYFLRTGDRDTISRIWPNIEAALAWIDVYGDLDGDGFVEYFRETEHGLANQGWKDSYDAVFHADGSLARGPIALCEVQGYVFAAWNGVARLAIAFGNKELAARLQDRAEKLREKFEDAFWCEDLGTYALALDGAKRPCKVRSSNAGHTLFCGLPIPDRARMVAEGLMSRRGFSGWGIRTIAQGEPRYNPMSYHNGSVWPHDNALIALGFARYGMKLYAATLFDGIFAAASLQDLQRLPELFCGFARRPHRGPTAYPVACSPQAWAAASIFGLLAACINIEVAEESGIVRFTAPVLPHSLASLTIANLRVGNSRIDLALNRSEKVGVFAEVLGEDGSGTVSLQMRS